MVTFDGTRVFDSFALGGGDSVILSFQARSITP